jgi:hypothetical protein
MKKFKIGGTCVTHRREKKPIQGFGVTVRRIESLGEPQSRLDDKIKMMLQKKDWKMWTEFIWFRIGRRRWAVVKAVMTLRVQ